MLNRLCREVITVTILALFAAGCGGSTSTPPPGKATSPSPAHWENNVTTDATLAWEAGEGALSYDVYFGSSSSAVQDADPESPEFVGNQTDLEYSPALEYAATYYWRVDSVGEKATTKGDVWRFNMAELRITTSELKTAYELTPYGVTLAASGGSGERTWSAIGLPVGLSCDAGTGVISGEADGGQAGDSPFTVELTVADDVMPGLSASEAFTLTLKGQQYYWSRTFGGAGLTRPADADVHSGLTFVVGGFSDTADFAYDFGWSEDSYTSAGQDDCFLTVIDSDGGYVETFVWGGTGYNWATGVRVDGAGNAYIIGFFNGTVDFGAPWGENDERTVSQTSGFLMKLDSSRDYVWTRVFDGEVQPSGISCDGDGNVYVIGGFRGNVVFGADWGDVTEKSSGAFRGFVLKVQADGGYGWAHVFTQSNDCTLSAITTDGDGNVYVGGYFVGETDFAADWGEADVRTPTGGSDAFVTRIDSDGGYGWTRTWGGAENETAYSVAAYGDGTDGHLYACGEFSGTVDFRAGWGGEPDERTSGGSYLMKIAADGNYGWVRKTGGSAHDVAVDGEGGALVTGHFRWATDFADDFDGASDARPAAAADSGYVTRIEADGGYGSTLILRGTTTYKGCSASTVVFDPVDNSLRLVGHINGEFNFAADWEFDDTRSFAGGAWSFVSKLEF